MAPKNDSLAAEISALEEKTFGKPAEDQQALEASEGGVEGTEGKPTDQLPAEDVVENPVVEPAEVDDASTEGVVKPAKAEEGEDWEKRFKRFKSTSDATVYGLRQKELRNEEIIQALQKQVNELTLKVSAAAQPVDPLGDLSQEERDLLGPEMLAVLKKASEKIVKANVEPIQEELKATKEAQAKREADNLKDRRVQADKKFLLKLEELVPNCHTIDKNPRFVEWMNMADPVSGNSRVAIFQNARSIGDVQRVAGFFKEFEEISKPKVNKKIEEQILPSTVQGSAPAPKKQANSGKLSQAEIMKFYDDSARGVYRHNPKAQQAMEKRIDAQLQTEGALR